MLIFRFLQIVSLAYLCSFFKMVSCQRLPAAVPEVVRKVPQRGAFDRAYKLYNQCSGKHVQIVGKVVNAKGLPSSTSANMSFISVHTRHHHNAINIMGQSSGRYLCFNRKGKLIVKFNGRSRLCFFKEEDSADHFTVFQSVHEPSWYVGFNRHGKPLKGVQYAKAKMRDCFHFVKRDHSYGLRDHRPPLIKHKALWRLKDHLRPHKRRMVPAR